jgi:hypothetical protein
LSAPVKIRLLQARKNADAQHFGQGAQPPVAMPKLHEPIEVERAASKLPEIGSFDLVHKCFQILELLSGSKFPDARFIKPAHDDDDRLLRRLLFLAGLTSNGADHQLVGRRRGRQGLIGRNCKLLIQAREVVSELPIRVAARQNDVSTPLRAINSLGKGL